MPKEEEVRTHKTIKLFKDYKLVENEISFKMSTFADITKFIANSYLKSEDKLNKTK